MALAELYAYVQALPDSAKKRKLIKQFNTASGLGTPQLNQSVSKKHEARGKRLGESIKVGYEAVFSTFVLRSHLDYWVR